MRFRRSGPGPAFAVVEVSVLVFLLVALTGCSAVSGTAFSAGDASATTAAVQSTSRSASPVVPTTARTDTTGVTRSADPTGISLATTAPDDRSDPTSDCGLFTGWGGKQMRAVAFVAQDGQWPGCDRTITVLSDYYLHAPQAHRALEVDGWSCADAQPGQLEQVICQQDAMKVWSEWPQT